MSKKVILSTLLASAALLGASATTHAATSDIKAESKKVTVTADKAKLYKDSKMKESSTPKKGTVYQVDGYRNIDGKHVYRVYQNNADNEKTYKGYIVDKDTKELKSEKASGQYVAKKGATMWNNFYWNNKKSVTSEEKVYFAKYSYTLGDGAKYFSVYYKDKDGKDTWAGYTNAVNVKALKATEETKYVTLKKDYSTWSNLYFKQHKDDFKASKGVNFKVKRYYTLNGNKFYSIYRTDGNGDEIWTGYVNGYSSVVEDLKATNVKEYNQAVQTTKDYNTYKNHFFNKKGQVKVGENVKAVRYYTYGNGKTYASIEDEKGEWLGYINTDALQSTNEMNEALPAAKEAIEKAQAILDKAQASQSTKAAAQKAIDEAKKLVENPKVTNTESIKNIPHQLEKAMEALKPAATSSDLQALENTLKDANEIMANKDKLGLTNTGDVQNAIDLAKPVLEAAKKGNATPEQVKKVIDALNDAIAKVGVDKDSIEKAVNTLKETAQNVYLTKEQESTLKDKVTEAVNKVEDTTAENAEDAKAAIDLISQAINDMNTKQPNKEDGEALNKAIENYDKLDKGAKQHLDWLFQNSEAAKTADEEANTILKELKKDPIDGTNEATTEETKEAVKDATDKLNKAMKDLSVNEDNTKNFMNEAKAAIEKLDEADKAKPTEDFKQLETTLKDDHSIENYENIIKGAKDLVNAIDAAQDKELNDVIAKAKRIEGKPVSQAKEDAEVTSQFQYGKYYEEASFKEMNTELGKAETAEKLTVDKITTDTKDAKENAIDALEKDIDALKVKNFETEEKDQSNTIELEKYTGDYNVKKTREWQSNPEDVLEIPGMLKDKQVVIPDQELSSTSEGNHLFPKHLEEDDAYEKWTFKFVEQDGHKVKASASVRGLFSAKKPLVKVDLTGLDFSDTTDMTSLFSSSPVFKYWTGAEKLVTNKVTSTKSMLWGTNIPNVDASQWDVSGVTNMENMFKNANVETIDMTGWKLNSDVNLGSGTSNMFTGANRLSEIKLPTDKESAEKIAKELQEAKVTHDVTLKQGDKVVAKYKADGNKLEAEGTKNNATITTDETTLKNPKALARTVMEAKEGDDKEFSNLPEAKQLAAMIYVGEEITAHSESDKAKGIAGIDPNVDWSEFNCESTGRSSLYDAEGLLQNYARNTKAVSLDEINKKLDKLVGNMEGLRVLDNQLAEHTKAVKKLAKEHEAQLKESKEKSGVEALQKELTTADRFIGSRGYELRGVDNWNEINKLTQNMMAAEKALSELPDQK